MDDGGRSEPRYPCRVCGRQFFKESLAKHENVCSKNAAKKRRVFDSAKQRAEGTEVTYQKIKQAQRKAGGPTQPVASKPNNWRAKHEDFINTVRAARGVSRAMAEGGPLPPPPPPSINPDYIQCPYCSRRFNQQAAERHINFCKEQSQRVNNRPPPNAAAKAKQATRLQYQPPKPKVKATGPSASPSSSGSGSRLPGPTSRGVPVGARAGMGAPAPRGRTGSYQAQGVVGVRAPQNYSRNASTLSDHDHPHPHLRSTPPTTPPSATTTTTTTTVVTTSTTPNARNARKSTRQFSHNPHRKLSGIGNHLHEVDEVAAGFDERENHSEVTPRSARREPHPHPHHQHQHQQQHRVRSGNRDPPPQFPSSRKEPSYADDFSYSSRDDESPVNSAGGDPVEDYLFRSPPDFPSKPLLHHKNGMGSAKGRHRGGGGGGGSMGDSSSSRMSKFCHECGSRYPVPTAKFCLLVKGNSVAAK